jgi:hypothetical protein
MLDGETLIAKTYQRAKALGAEVLTVTNRDYYFISRDEQDRVGGVGGLGSACSAGGGGESGSAVEGKFLLEPFGRNTAAAIALGAHCLAAESPDAVMLVLPERITTCKFFMRLPIDLRDITHQDFEQNKRLRYFSLTYSKEYTYHGPSASSPPG